MKKYKTTKEDFEIFKKEAKRWINKFGLLSYQISFFREEQPINFIAIYRGDIENRQANIYFNTISDSKLEGEEIRQAAFHEVIEVLLGRLRSLACTRYLVSESDINEEIHTIIVTLENAIWEKDKNYDKKEFINTLDPLDILSKNKEAI